MVHETNAPDLPRFVHIHGVVVGLQANILSALPVTLVQGDDEFGAGSALPIVGAAVPNSNDALHLPAGHRYGVFIRLDVDTGGVTTPVGTSATIIVNDPGDYTFAMNMPVIVTHGTQTAYYQTWVPRGWYGDSPAQFAVLFQGLGSSDTAITDFNTNTTLTVEYSLLIEQLT
jgi:hypothetical protein